MPLENPITGDAYGVNRQEIEETFRFLINHHNTKTNSTVDIALEVFRETRLDLADCLIVAQATGKKLASFDKEMLKSTRVSPYWN
ncbi:MAG: hypothetical protein NUV80_02565 [Candidatus Berkelbacteria bacterium]|nr:hypothetical protein [Candidatus Berkelbacteria bacterium]